MYDEGNFKCTLLDSKIRIRTLPDRRRTNRLILVMETQFFVLFLCSLLIVQYGKFQLNINIFVTGNVTINMEILFYSQ